MYSYLCSMKTQWHCRNADVSRPRPLCAATDAVGDVNRTTAAPAHRGSSLVGGPVVDERGKSVFLLLGVHRCCGLCV